MQQERYWLRRVQPFLYSPVDIVEQAGSVVQRRKWHYPQAW
jgi:hypothetical protein